LLLPKIKKVMKAVTGLSDGYEAKSARRVEEEGGGGARIAAETECR
jgi:hypothetical protein